MPALRSLRKPLLAALATLFAAAALLYSGLWTLYGNRGVPVELGFENRYIAVKRCQFVQSVVRGSPAERADLKPGDCIIRVNSTFMEAEDSLTRVWAQHKP